MEITKDKDVRFLYKRDALKHLNQIDKLEENNHSLTTSDFTGSEYEYWMGSLYHQDFENTITKTEERLKYFLLL